jgi:hypothetical protein
MHFVAPCKACNRTNKVFCSSISFITSVILAFFDDLVADSAEYRIPDVS